MIEENGSSHLQNHQTSQGSQSSESEPLRVKKIKKISKKGKAEVIENKDLESSFPKNLTKEQKKEIQKEKNRQAAQLSRDRQKKYVEDLEGKIVELQTQLSHQLCSKCKSNLNQHSTVEEEELIENIDNNGSNGDNIYLNDSDVDPLPFFRVPFDPSEVGFGKMNTLFCLTLLLAAMFCFSSSVENKTLGISSQISRRVAQAIDVCEMQQEDQTRQSLKASRTLTHWPFNSMNGKPAEQCKRQFWEQYLEKAQQEMINSFSKSLVTCTSPGLIHISNLKSSSTPVEEQWTILITDPSITRAHIEKDGEFKVDEVNYLDGVYQMVADRVKLKKVIGKNCLA